MNHIAALLHFATLSASRALYRLAYWVSVVTASLVCATLLLFFVARAAIRPAPGAWATTVQVGPVPVEVGVASLIWLGTTPWVAQRLAGHTLPSPAGPLRLGWVAQDQVLTLRCQPCSLRNPSWGTTALRLPAVDVSVRRTGMQLQGTVASGAVAASWRGQLTHTSLLLDMDLPPTPVRDGYALFAEAIPELKAAQIAGTFALRATLSLPSRALTVQPQLVGMAVQGLGTDQWANAQSTCNKGLPARTKPVALGPNSLLARAVVAAEDQRFFEHTGYDIVEITHALRSNNQRAVQAAGETPHTSLRGASTLSQQVAKLLVTGGERTPVRKLRELLYAVEMEHTLGKARILRLYLDNAPWGATVCGAQAAAHTYFAKRADQLTTDEAVWLAAMLHNPALEARRWAATGRINEPRAVWVASNLRKPERTARTTGRQTCPTCRADLPWVDTYQVRNTAHNPQ
ncbi:transglycosylase domain-containing protein [Rhodoferax sp. AJA081-3]|uniref:biosynthetic peptidoglycan transglycosylase n=1 Tax=Rhodoferax sp. AJA081-3 TaxID=2752316 RepID=UPI001AE0C30B|nr:biosynthetic peptidoglycan transglycosylase [Rhodoferax sp. AJA081-3]QTN27216.1 transglycosylase domain-containing protein [Rhodoferax sp. AJA081-3]